MLAFFYVTATLVVLCAEINVIRVDRLTPRAPLTPFTDNVNLTAGDRDLYAGLGKAQRSKGFENVDVTFDAPVVLAAGLDQQRAQPRRGSRDIFRLDPTRS